MYRDKIKNANLGANAGCYVTGEIVAGIPLVKNGLVDTIIADSKSGVSGAGINPTTATHYPNIGDNVVISTGTTIKDEIITSNCLVFGQSPNLEIKPKSNEYMDGIIGGFLKI